MRRIDIVKKTGQDFKKEINNLRRMFFTNSSNFLLRTYKEFKFFFFKYSDEFGKYLDSVDFLIKTNNEKLAQEEMQKLSHYNLKDDFIQYVKKRYLFDYKLEYICGPKDLGIEKKQITLLQSLYQKKKIHRIRIKEGIPFVPSFLIAFIITLFLGNVLQFLM